MTPMQKSLVQLSFKQIVSIADIAAELFYDRLFELDPSLKPLFKGNMKDQGRKLMNMIGTAVIGLDHLDQLVPAVQSLGKRHVAYGVKDSHYDTVATALLWTLEKGLGEEYTDDMREAWVVVYTLLTSTMKEAAAEVEAA